MRLTPTEKRAKELSNAVKGLGTAKRPSINLNEISKRYTTQTDELSMKIAPHIKALRDELLTEMRAQPTSVEITTDMVRQIVAEMKKLPENDRLEVQDIRNHQAFIFNGNKYGMHEMMHGGAAAATSGITVVAITGMVNDSNVTFSALTEPTLLNINGAFYQKTGGTYTWTYGGGTITLNNPVGTGGQIYCI